MAEYNIHWKKSERLGANLQKGAKKKKVKLLQGACFHTQVALGFSSPHPYGQPGFMYLAKAISPSVLKKYSK